MKQLPMTSTSYGGSVNYGKIMCFDVVDLYKRYFYLKKAFKKS
jgi:hypothetical protein